MLNKKRVVVIGAGFGGLQVVHKLGNQKEVDVVLIDKRNHHLFQPLLYQVATAVLSPADIAIPTRSILNSYKNVRVIMGEVHSVDFKKQIVYYGEKRSLDYDYLVLAIGSKTSYFGKDSWKKYTIGLKNLLDALAIRKKILMTFEEAEIAPDPIDARKLLNYVVVGGGPTGVEMAGAIAELSYQIMKKDFRNIDPRLAKVTLIEAGPRLLSQFHPELSEFTKKSLEKRGVRVLLNSPVRKIDSKGVHLDTETIESRTIIWAAGVEGTDFALRLGVPLDKSKRILVDSECRVKGFSNVFALGDAANFSEGLDRPLPGVSPVAMQQGRYIADWILRDIQNKPKKPFRYFDKGSMATIGRKDAVAQIGKIRLKGFLGWLAWLFVHLFYQVGFKNKVSILISWIWSYLVFRAGARLIQEEKEA